MAKINTVLFDFDGTIMDTNEVILQSWQHTFKTVEGKERPVEDILGTFGEPLYVTMERVLPQITAEEGATIYRSFHYDHFTDLISLFPGVINLMDGLKKRGCKIGLVTSRLRHTTEIGLRKYDLEKYFDTIVTCDDTEKFKPDPEPALVALEKLASKPEESIMIGDSMFDILCAKGAGVKTVLVGWALAIPEEERTGANAPDYTIEKAEDLLDIIDNL